MKRQTAGRVAKPQLCQFCGKPLAPQKPRYMVVSEGGTIWGYYHSGCADRLAFQWKHLTSVQAPPGEEVGKVIPPAREETLPW